MKNVDPRHDRWIVAAFAILAFLGCLVLLRVGGMYVSPDETANAFFAKTFVRTGALSVFEPLNADLGDALHPRSVISIASRLVPSGFIGLPVIFGTVASFTGYWSLPFLTPLLAALALFAWYATIKKIFDREVALLSAILLAIHPAWWYYSARSFMPNVPFVALLILAAYLLVVRPSRAQRFAIVDPALAGSLAALALFIRPSEIVWLTAASVIAVFPLLIGRRGQGWSIVTTWRPIAAFLAGLAIAIIPLFAFNASTYGSPLTTGYTAVASAEAGESVAPIATASQPSQTFKPLQALLFPFGLSKHDVKVNMLSYGFGLFWWMTVLAVIGFPLAFPRKSLAKEHHAARKSYLAFAVVASAYLALMYGSWTFFDNPDPTQVTIGNSHVRYWLPAFVLATPFVALGIRWISRRAFTDFARRAAVAVLVTLCLGLSVRVAFLSPQDGIVTAANGLAESRTTRDTVLDLTERDSVIVVDRADKLFFPYRRVLYPLRDDATYALMPRIALRVPLYYYGITLPQTDVDWLNADRLAKLGLKIDAVHTFRIETLYRVSQTP